MQQEATKKNKKLIWLIAGLAALLVVAGVVLAMFLLPGAEGPVETGPVGGRPDLYWNVDRLAFTDNGIGLSEREPGEDGLYHVRFAYNGEIVEFTIADKRLVNAIDSMDVVGLVKDESGNVIDAVDPTTIATEVVRDAFVQKVEDGSLRVNTSIALNGMETIIQFSELTQIYNVDEIAEIPGQIDEAELLDRVLVYANDKEEVTHIFLVDRQPEGGVYWRLDEKNVDSNGNTKREPDENGIYHIKFAYKGQQVELKCKDKELVNEIDGLGTALSDIGLQVDEEGFITGAMDSAIALRGKLLGASYHVTAINGNEITATYLMPGSKNTGKSFTINLNENTEIYNVCYSLDVEKRGMVDELRLEDRIIVYTDLEGNPTLVYIQVRRYTDGVLFYNLSRQYDDTNKVTNRKPDANGYYVFNVVIEGKNRTIRTKDKALATKMDSYSARIAGVVLDGDIITYVCHSQYIAGSSSYVPTSDRLVTGLIGSILSFVSQGSELTNAKNLVMSPDVQIYDISGRPGTRIGQKTTVKEGDRVALMADYQLNITHIFVKSSYSGLPVYYNLNRQFDSVTDGTKRVADAEGYYTFSFAIKGKQVTAKTKSKEIADFIDRQSPYFCALDIRDGIIRDAYPATSSYEMGYSPTMWGYFQRYNGKKSMNASDYQNKGSTRYKLAENVKIYNVSGAYDSFRGEPTTLQEGDRIVTLAVGKTQEIVEIYVVTRQIASELYYHVNRQYNWTTKETTREPDADGYYVIELAVGGKIKTFKTKDKEIATRVDSQDYAFGLKLSGNTIIAAFAATNVKGITSQIATKFDVTKVSGNKVNLESLCPTNTTLGTKRTDTMASGCKIYDVSGAVVEKGTKSTLKVGDRVLCYANSDGELTYIFITAKSTHAKGVYSYCEHCDKEVYWQPYENKFYDVDTHVYLTHSRDWSTPTDSYYSTTAVEDRAELTLDLNGQTMGIRSANYIYSCFNIVDTVGGGKIVTDVENKGNDKYGNGSVLIPTTGGTINLYSGTITRNATSDAAARGGCIIVGGKSAFNMYGGTVTGGMAEVGANIYAVGGSSVNLQGGVIDGDITIASSTVKLTVGGSVEINKGTQGGLSLPGGMLLSLKDVTKDTKICVDTVGAFTETVSNADDYLDNFYSSEELLPVSNMNGALAVGKFMPCPHCDGEMALFGKFSPGACAGNAHLMVLEDMTLYNQIQIGSASSHDDDVVVDLNGKTITLERKENVLTSTGRLALVYSSLSIMDSSAEKTGKIYNNSSEGAAGGIIMSLSGAKNINLYSGSLVASPDCLASEGGILRILSGSFNMYGGLVSGGHAKTGKNGGNVFLGSNTSFTMKGGKITGGTSEALGGNIYAGSKTVVNIENGIIENGTAKNGGNIYAASSTVSIGKDATVIGGVAVPYFTVSGNADKYDSASGIAGNIYMAGTSDVTVQGLVTEGSAFYSGNIEVHDSTCKLVIDGGTVSNGTTNGWTGGNITAKGAVIIKKDGVLTGGTANVHENTANPSIFGRGGNIFINTNGSLTVEDGGIVSFGHGNSGGNILLAKSGTVLDIQAGAQILGGTAVTQSSGNSIYITNDASNTTIAGIVKAAVAPVDPETPVDPNAPAPVATGGDIVIAGTNAKVSVTGAAQIDKLVIPSGAKITADGLSEGAKIYVNANGVFTKELESVELAEEYVAKAYFESLSADAVDNDDKALVVGFVAKRWCEHCQQYVVFTPFEEFGSKSAAITSDAHIIFTPECTTVDKQMQIGNTTDKRNVCVVLDLNGQTVDVPIIEARGEASSGRLAMVYGKLCIQDSSAAKNGKIVGTSSSNGGTILVRGGAVGGTNGGNLVLYSGELTHDASVRNSRGGVVTVETGKFVMYGGKVTGGDVYYQTGKTSDYGYGGSLYVTNSVFEMNGGQISGGIAEKRGGCIYATTTSTITINNGSISGGAAELGGNIYVNGTACTVNLSGNVLSGGTASSAGGDLYVKECPNVTVSGAIKGAVALEGGVKLVLGELTESAELFITADDGAFTATNPSAQTYLNAGYIKAADAENKAITVDGENQLVLGNK